VTTIVFKDLHNLVLHSQRQQNKSRELFERLKDKSFGEVREVVAAYYIKHKIR
jgi:hypothetical protein